MIDFSKRAEILMGLILLGCLGLILGALAFQHLGGLVPCALCYKQRWAYYGAIALVPVAMFLYGRGMLPATKALLFILAAMFFANMVLGIYHSGVEWKWWPGPASCAPNAGQLDATIDLIEALKKVKVVSCEEVQWRFLGLSMAGYSALCSFGLGLMAVFIGITARKKD